jgi:hypothetical protein
MRLKGWLLGLCTVTLLALGCGPRPRTVTGVVLIDGNPLPDGDILFIDVLGVYGPEHTKIKDGRFELKVRPGDKRVEIRASREVPEKRTPMGPYFEDYIPNKYNTQSDLKAHIEADGETHLEFPLKSY